MTRDEAVKRVLEAVCWPIRKGAVADLAALNDAEDFISALAALGLLKLDDHIAIKIQTSNAENIAEAIANMIQPHTKPEWKTPHVTRAGLVERTPAHSEPPRCEPPPEHREKRWHWIAGIGLGLEPSVVEWIDTGWRYLEPRSGVIGRSAENAALVGWRYVAPCEEPRDNG